MRIYKFYLESPGTVTRLRLPVGARCLSVGLQDNRIVVWVLLDPLQSQTITATFTVLGTGWDVDPSECVHFLGTVQDAPFVWHVFVTQYGEHLEEPQP